ncbi:polyketide synthase-like protein [Paraphoma chrysanthemicola]|nr:polyketide synthase-like protein [Paraphoma chrysanthemicola]
MKRDHESVPGIADEHSASARRLDEQESKEPIAIVGFALKFPQDITSEENLWKLLLERRSTKTDVPANRWNLDGFYKPSGNWPGTVNSRGGHFIADDPARFDAPFFSIQPAEAECMDPQQRFLLETSYHALENAGIPMESAMGTRTSVHVGCLLQEYSQISQRDTDMPGNYQIVGSSGLSMLANRLSWFYNFTGPSMTVDTACSGSLLSVHLACQDLLMGSVDMAFACGSNLSLVPDSTALLSALNMMSPDSTCYSFDERANGYSRSEGFGVVILKRLSQAISDGDTVRAIIRGTGSNQDGHTPGITQPSRAAQERLSRETYHRAGLDMNITRYFESHGTGTKLGDPTEAGAISNAFAARTAEDPLYIGALKSNIGHPEAASGIAAIIKTVLVLENGIIPPNLYPERISPFIATNCPNLKFPLTATPWPTSGVRRASVNSMGYGGTNVHVVLDDILSYTASNDLRTRHRTSDLSSYGGSAQVDELVVRLGNEVSTIDHQDQAKSARQHKLLVLSAFDEYALKRAVSSHENWLRNHSISEDDFNDLAYTLTSKRSSFPWKTYCVTSSTSLSELSWSQPARGKQDAHLCFVFTGQGAIWHGMGRELLTFDAFRESIDRADEYLRTVGSGWSVSDELYKVPVDDSSIHHPELSQALCTILQVAIVDLLLTWNVRPSAVVGHSSGEIAAAYACGAITREAAWSIAYFRGLAVAITQDLVKATGSMVAVQATPTSIEALLEKQTLAHPDDAPTIACYNSRTSLTIAGSCEAIYRLTDAFTAADMKYKVLDVGVAYHSAHMEPVAAIYRRLLKPIEAPPLRAGETCPKFVSSITGKLCRDTSALRKPEYWVQNLLLPVRFDIAVDEICATDVNYFVEIGPHSLLRTPIRDAISQHGRDIASEYASVLVRNRPADITALECAGRLHAAGAPISLAEVNRSHTSSAKALTTLPPYPFNDKTKYWLEGRTSTQYRFRQHVHHEFLGTRVDDWNGCEARWTNRIMLEQSPWLKDHKVNGMIIFPAAAFIVMALEAARQVYGNQDSLLGYKLKDVNFPKAVALSEQQRGTELQLTLRSARTQPSSLKSGNTWDQFTIFVYENDGWVECCSGSIAVEYDNTSLLQNQTNEREESFGTVMRSMKTAEQHCRLPIDSAAVYDAFERADLLYGPYFRAMEDIHWDGINQATGAVQLQQWKTLNDGFVDPHLIHPAALDAILQMTFPAYSIYAKNSSATTVPTGFRHAWFSASLASTSIDPKALVHAEVTERGFRNKVFSIAAALAGSETPCFLAEMETATIGGGASASDAATKSLYKIEYKPDVDLLPNRTLFLEPALDKDTSWMHDKEMLCLASMQGALEHLSGVPQHLPIHLQEYVQWMKIQVEQRGATISESVESLCKRLEHADVEARLLVRVARNLPSILTGEVDPLNLLFADSILSDFYSNFHSNQELLARAAEEVELLAHKYPSMKVLEVGAGTGSATEHVLRGLGNSVAEYVYTDVTPSFFLKAKERFPSPKLTFKVLDISRDPLAQGFAEGEFDLIIAANVLHAANGIQKSLEQCRTLLRPNGRILLLEMTNREHLLEPYIFGLLPGLSRDASPESAKNNSPLLNESEWADMLQQTGFSGMDTCISDAGFLTEESVSAIMISRAIAPPVSMSDAIQVIYDESSAQQAEVLHHLIEYTQATGQQNIVALEWKAATEQALAHPVSVFIADLDGNLLGRLNEHELSKLKGLLTSTEALLWVTSHAAEADHNPVGGLVPGLARTLATENEQCRVVSISLDATAATSTSAKNIRKIMNALLRSQGIPEDEYIEQDGILCVPRVVEDKSMSAQICSREQVVTRPWIELDAPRLTIGTVGRLNTLHFEQAQHSPITLSSDDIFVEVKAVGLTQRDLLVAQGQVHEEMFGSSFAGIITKVSPSSQHTLQVGTKVFGVTADAMSKVVRCKPSQVQTFSSEMDFSEAATYPLAYCTAYYALVQCARVKHGDSVLIHCAASEVGHATLQIAQLHGCEIFVTVDNDDQAAFLTEKHEIPRTHIFSSRTLDFSKGIRRLTQGRGVNIAISSLAGEAARESWNCLASFGRLIDVGEKQSTTNLPMGKGRMFVGLDLHELAQSEDFGVLFGDVVQLLKEKNITPSTALQKFKQTDVEAAFRLLQDEAYFGRVAIEMASDEVVSMVLSQNSKPLFDPEASYLLAGGFGGIGQSVARWMVQNGTKHLILPSRSTVEGSGSSREELVQELRAQGADVRAPLCDIADATQLEDTLKNLGDMPQIKGCIQAAMNVRDSSFANMGLDDWHASLSPKLAGSWNLHRLLPANLDFFVMFSSSTGIMGSFGQSNYTAGNTYQDALGAHRVKHGQRAHSIAMSMVMGVGWVAENTQVQALLRVRGMLEEVSLDDIYELLRYCCDPEHTDVGSQIITPLSLPADLRALGIVEPLGSTRPIYSYLHTLPSRYNTSSEAAGGQESKKLPSFSLQDAVTLKEATDIITEAIQNQLSSLLVVSKEDIDPKKPIHKYGVDSLVAVEMRNWFAKGVGADVGTIEILDDIGIAQLAAKVAMRSKFVKEELKE